MYNVYEFLKFQSYTYLVLYKLHRELAFQISEQFEALGAGIGVKCAVIVGGVDMMTQSLALAKKPHIVIGKYCTVVVNNDLVSVCIQSLSSRRCPHFRVPI